MAEVGRDLAWLEALPGIPDKAERELDRSWRSRFRASLSLLRQYCADKAHSLGPNLLEEILLSEQRDVGVEWAYYWKLAACGILLRGPAGVDRLIDILRRPSRTLATGTIVQILWRAASGLPLLSKSDDLVGHLANFDLPDGTSEAARIALDDLIIDAQGDAAIFSKLISVVDVDALSGGSQATGFAGHFMRVSSESTIRLTHRILDAFSRMVMEDLPEEHYQAFLKQHPVLLDPLSAEVLPKHRLGSELVTDFVIRRHDYRYVAVEIEKPQDSIFTLANDFTAAFTHAFGQVIDFQSWIGGNIAYARTRLPHIDNPQGLLIMGRRSDLDEGQVQKLRWWQANSMTVEVLTFDDLVERGRLLLRSLRAPGS